MPFFCVTKKSRDKFKKSWERKENFKGLSVAKNCLRPESAPLKNFEVSFPAYRSAFFCLEKLLLTLELHEHEQLYILILHYAWKSFLILKIHIFWTRFFIRKTIYHTTCFRECEDSSLPLFVLHVCCNVLWTKHWKRK